MHWKGLRLVADGSSKRQSTIEPPVPAQSRRSEQLPRQSPLVANPRLSESTARGPGLSPQDGTDESRLDVPGELPDLGLAPSDFAGPSSGDTPSLRRNRFSFMRLRHASDPQLSKSYAQAQEVAPPVPSLPPPKIITTAPTSHELDQPAKHQPRFRLRPSSRKHSMEELSRNSTDEPRNKPPRKNQGSTDSQADPSLSTFQRSMDEPGRLSTTSLRSGSREMPNDSQRSSVTDPRFSESSRSDQSYGDQAAYRSTSPREAFGSTSSAKRGFRMPRLKRTRSPLFPLPPKPPPGQSILNGPRFPPVDTPKSDGSGEHDQVSPLPSPSRSSVGLATAVGAPPLIRNNSNRSIQSNPSHKGRGRSSTMDSLAENQDDLSPVPPYLGTSGRTSTSTTGRKSFGDLFNISQRLRQNSEPPFPRHGSPGLGGSSTPVSSKPDLPPIPAKEENDTPATYLTKLEDSIPRGMVGGVLAQSGDEFFKVSLRKYMRSFSYFGDPMDMAIRKLLMEVELPKETQQIDRFLQAFADRYHECNPGIFANTDQAYFIAFSILILHTDVFNKNNKRKMQKPDYVKNTRGEGVSDDILECFYENISYTPFIHVEDTNLKERHLTKPRRALFKSTSTENLARIGREPVDPYTLIMDGKIQSLRPSLQDVMELEDTYNHFGSAGPPDMDDLHQAFTKSGILQIVSLRSRPDAFIQMSLNPGDSNPGLVDIKVAKVGLLWRKDPKKKRARSPWAEWGAVLTFSQLYFFRNVTWVRSLMAQHDNYVKNNREGTLVFKPPLAEFKPDGIMSTNDAVALLDTNYKKHKHAFSFVRHNSLEEVFLATSESEMNDWISKLNYAAAFRTTGVRTKGMIATNYEGQRYRTSQRMETASINSHQSAEREEPPSPSIATDIVAEFVAARRQLMSQKIKEANEKLFVTQKQLEELLRNARHLQVLTPVNPRARESVIMAAGRMAAKLKWVRQDIWRNKCYREVLLRDMGEDESFVEGHARSVADQTISSDTARIPSTSGPSIVSDPSLRHAPSIIASSHDANEQAVGVSDNQPTDTTLLHQPSVDEMRRPSIPASTASSDARIGRPLSIAMPDKFSDGSSNQLERESSVLSRGSKFDGASLGSRASKITSPVSYDEGEERLLRETGLIDMSGSPRPRKQSSNIPDTGSDLKLDESSELSLSDHKPNRVRRSFRQNLPRHQSHKKNRASVSSLPQADEDEDPKEVGGLSRKSASFTVHGKKASIVTFGSEWQNMPPEERLKLRKPTPHEEPRASEPTIFGSPASVVDGNAGGLRPQSADSFRSASTTTRLSIHSDGGPVVDFFKDAYETFGEPLPKRTVVEPSSVPPHQTDTDLVGTGETQRSTSGSGSVIFAPRLAAQGDDRPTSSTTSLSERAVDTPSSENLRQQAAVGA